MIQIGDPINLRRGEKNKKDGDETELKRFVPRGIVIIIAGRFFVSKRGSQKLYLWELISRKASGLIKENNIS